MGTLVAIGVILVFTGMISVLWVRGIDYMDKNYPDYKIGSFYISPSELFVNNMKCLSERNQFNENVGLFFEFNN